MGKSQVGAIGAIGCGERVSEIGQVDANGQTRTALENTVILKKDGLIPADTNNNKSLPVLDYSVIR